MSCSNNNCYLPIPPREWSRVQNRCSLETADTNNSLVRVPYSNLIVPGSQIAYYLAMQNKGNILQYKANSSNITQAQKYSKIAKGQWVNRNTTWATQSTRGYTNPNTTSLKRFGNIVNIAIDPITGQNLGPTTLPVTCPKPINPFNPYIPINGGGGSVVEPPIPPPIPPTPGSDVTPPIIPVTPAEPIVIQDGGSLVCSIQENICTGLIKSTLSQQLCNLTTDSDVPGPIQELCWNDGNPTWYPRQRYTMTNSANKWPTNSGYNNVIPDGPPATLFSAIPINPPTIVSVTFLRNVVTLTWIPDNACLPTAYYDIFENDFLVKRVPANIFSVQLFVTNCNTYNYFIVASNGSVSSVPSNTVSINIAYVEPPIDLSYIVISNINNEIQLNWNDPFVPCITISYYKIYQTGLTSQVYTSFTNSKNIIITQCNTFIFYVTAIDINGEESLPSNSIEAIIYYVNPPTNLNYTTTGSGQINLSWTASVVTCAPIDYYIIYQDGVNITTIPFPDIDLTISGLTNCSTYNYYIVAVDTNGQQSDPSNILNATVLWVNPPTNFDYTTTGSGQILLSWNAPNPNCVPPLSYTIVEGSNSYSTLYPNTTYSISGLTNCSSYTFVITSVDALSNVSTPISLNVIPYWPNPTVLSGIQDPTDYTAIILNWTNPSQCVIVDFWNVYQDGSFLQTYSSNIFTATILGLVPTDTTTFYVTASSGSAESDPSNTVTATFAPPDPPTNVTASASSPSSATVSWTEPGIQNPQITYTVYYSTSSTGPWTTAQTDIPYGTSTTTVSGLSSGSTYYFAVASINIYDISSTLAISPSVTLPYAISVTASGYNSTLSNFSTNSNQGAIVFTDQGTFNFSYLYSGIINIICIGPGGNGLYGGNNAGGLFGGGGGGGGGGGAGNLTSLGNSIVGITFTATPGSPGIQDDNTGTNTTVTYSSTTITATKGNNGTHGGDASLTSYGGSGVGGSGNGNGGNGDGGAGGGGQDGGAGSPDTYTFTVNSVAYNIYFGGGGGGGKCTQSGYYSGGSSSGGQGGAGPNSGGPNRTGAGGDYNISAANNIQVGGGGGGGSGQEGGGGSQYDGGSGSKGIVVVYWSI
jgi:hypothetical protein